MKLQYRRKSHHISKTMTFYVLNSQSKYINIIRFKNLNKKSYGAVSKNYLTVNRTMPKIPQNAVERSTFAPLALSISVLQCIQKFKTLLHSLIFLQGPSYEDAVNIRKQNLSPALLTYYKRPLLIHQGHMQWLFDHEGTRFLDLFGGIVTISVGHCHP